MKRQYQSEKGVALVITLVMLAIVTFMAVVFLAMSRRERVSVKVTEDQVIAKLMADTALARAQAQAVGTMLAAGNRLKYDIFNSTNFINPAGFQSQPLNQQRPTNVNFQYANGNPVVGDDLLRLIANLQYDARVPVFVQTNSNSSFAPEFRFYMDLNRNRFFETNGYLPEVSATGGFFNTNGVPISSASGPNVLRGNFVGDPEWVGVLERPEFPHSETNRFIGRYAFLAVPAGKTLDLNNIGNEVNQLSSAPSSTNGFFRNQGYGSWELNLAAFFRDLNTNGWANNSYRYDPFSTTPFNGPAGAAFDNARAILSYRNNGNPRSLPTLSATFDSTVFAEFSNDAIDNYGNGPVWSYVSLPPVSPTPDQEDSFKINNWPWPGNPSTNGNQFYDAQDLYSRSSFSGGFADLTSRLNFSTRNSASSYDRYTFYRLMSQMGVDSSPALKTERGVPKIHLNYTNIPGTISTNLVPWATNSITSSNYFTWIADALIKQAVQINRTNNSAYIGYVTNYTRTNVSATNILVYWERPVGSRQPVTEYSSEIHRLLQVAANIHDNLTNRSTGTSVDFPTVFRPVFRVGRHPSTNPVVNAIFIAGYREETNASFFTGFPWLSPEQFIATNRTAGLDVIITNATILGVPAIIGAKKELPNFNEFSAQTGVEVVRKLLARKSQQNQLPNQFSAIHLLGISNVFGVEGWNPYVRPYRGQLQLTARAQAFVSLYERRTNSPSTLVYATNQFFTPPVINYTNWPGWTNGLALPFAMKVPIFTNVSTLPLSVLLGSGPPWFLPISATNAWQTNLTIPQLDLVITNAVQYILTDSTTGRIIDLVNLNNLITTFDINYALTNLTAGSGTNLSGATFYRSDLITRSNRNLPSGVWAQIDVSTGDPNTYQNIWASYNAIPVSDKMGAITNFGDFLTNASTRLTELELQAPFTPGTRLYKQSSWQANDPFVHYYRDDLNPFAEEPSSPQAINVPFPPSNIGLVNQRYNPWEYRGAEFLLNAQTGDSSLGKKDPNIRRPDDWQFPINRSTNKYFRFANIGQLGQVHRGTPWQTIYLKSIGLPGETWRLWAGSHATSPTNDWRLLDIFTAAPSENAARGLLSVNQTNLAAWSAVLSGVHVVSNSAPNSNITTPANQQFTDLIVQPNSPQLRAIVRSLNDTRNQVTNGVYLNIGDILRAPGLSVNSPFLNLSVGQLNQLRHGLTDDVVERIPQQIMSLVRTDEPKFVVYAFGQSLKPAERSLTTTAQFYNLCTNYQITGEVATKTVFRIEGDVRGQNAQPRAVVESFSVLPPPE
ncbi:MAG: hypothetical protein SFY81_15230 [Verrucomicrobiota bacterium]|nr:hypothetical protein [Verrucomicrobiota bacterium]